MSLAGLPVLHTASERGILPHIISHQIGRSGTSIGANIRETQYAHGKAGFVSKLQIALKEANETGYWLELLYRTNYIDEATYKNLNSACTYIAYCFIRNRFLYDVWHRNGSEQSYKVYKPVLQTQVCIFLFTYFYTTVHTRQ